MLAARDQENLAHVHQAGAVAKQLNQGTRQHPPKTPGNKALKTPFKLPLNDENSNGGLGAGKGGLKTIGKGNENMTTGKKGGLGAQNAFMTPMAQKTRAPLGMKTTNAKTKIFQTPAPIQGDGLGKTNQKSVSARKAKPRVSHAEMTKLELGGDGEGLEEREIEYMPPKPKDLPDIPDDIRPVNLSMFEGEGRDIMRRAAMAEKLCEVIERQEKEQAAKDDRNIRKAEAAILRDIEATPMECLHSPECDGEVCQTTIENEKAAEDKYQKTIAAIEAEAVPAWKKVMEKEGQIGAMPKPAASTISKPKLSNTVAKPSTKTSARATKPLAPSAKARLMNTSLASRPKKTLAPTNPSPMRHNAALAASRTTMGYSKGRQASATLRKSVLPGKGNPREVPDTTLSPAEYLSRYGVPRVGTDIWFRCKKAGCFDEEVGESWEQLVGLDGGDDFLREEAEQDFVLTLRD